jgi:hypothetical protein
MVDFPSRELMLLSLIAVVAFCFHCYTRYRCLISATPPGPVPIPFLGNIFDIPAETYWVTYNEWAKKYGSEFFFFPRHIRWIDDLLSSGEGDLISVRAFGQLTVIINSAKAARELLGRRSSNYSTKPRLAMLEL